MPAPRTQPDCTPPPPPGLEVQARLGLLSPRQARRPPPTLTPSLQPQVSTTQVGTHTALISYAQKECKYRPGGNPPCHRCRSMRWSWPIPEAPACCRAHGKIRTAQTCRTRPPSQCRQRSHASSISSLFSAMESRSSTQEPHSDHSSDLWMFHAVILQEASDHVPHVSDQFIAYTGTTDLAILLNDIDDMLLGSPCDAHDVRSPTEGVDLVAPVPKEGLSNNGCSLQVVIGSDWSTHSRWERRCG